MPMHDRAAQFSSFAALVGFDSIIEETERLTHTKVELDDDAKALLNEKLVLIERYISRRPEIAIVYFLPDERKDGGEYVTHVGSVKRIDTFFRTVDFTDGVKVPVDNLYSVEGEWFKEFLSED